MLRKSILFAVLFFMVFSPPSRAQSAASNEKPVASNGSKSSPSKPASIETRIEEYLRNLYAWDPSFEVKVGPSKASPVKDFLEVPVTVSKGGKSNSASVYVSKDGNFLIQGELSDMSVDPFAETRSKLHIENWPSMGPADAKVVMVEFGDLECPSCRQLDLILRDFLPRHAEVRLVFKPFPLTEVHPWAMTAAIATQCAFQQNPGAFWKMHDAIYDSQELISPSNVWDKMIDLGTQFGLNVDSLKACMSGPDAANQVKQSIEEGHSLGVTGTPTTFINGRRVVGPDKSLIEQYVAFIGTP